MSSYAHSSDWEDADVRALVDGCARNRVHPLHVLACMFNESRAYARTRNPGGVDPTPADLAKPAVAVGLIQFTHAWLGANADLDAFRARPVAGQLPFVHQYFADFCGELMSVELVYCAMFIPYWVAKNPVATTVLTAPQGPFARFYAPNRSLDVGSKGYITLDDLRVKASTAAQGPRWTELAGRVLAATQARPTDPQLPPTDDDPPVFVPDTLGHEDEEPPSKS